MRHDGGQHWYQNPDETPTYRLGGVHNRYGPGGYADDQPLSLRERLADPAVLLAEMSPELRRRGAAVGLLATAEMSVISQQAGHPGWALAFAVLVLAPLHAAVSMVLLWLLGRLTHRMAGLLHGRGDRQVTTEVVVLFSALLALPAGVAFLLWGRDAAPTTVLEVVLAVVALALGVRVVGRLEGVTPGQGAVALLLPGVLVVVVMVVLALLETYLIPASWRLG